MTVSLELFLSILALVISLCSFASNQCRCNHATPATPSDSTDAHKSSMFPAGKPTTKEWTFFLSCVLATTVILQGIKTLFAVIGLAFPVGGYLIGSCFMGVLFTIWYCDDRYFHYFHPTANTNTDEDRKPLINAKDWQAALRFGSFIGIGAFVVCVAVTLVVENITL